MDLDVVKDRCKFIGVIVAVILLFALSGFLLGKFLQTGALLTITIVSILFTYIWKGISVTANSIPFLSSIAISISAWITWYFTTNQHVVGDIMREFILR